jgi:hypothetical protein
MSLATAFAADLSAGMQYADALGKHVAGRGAVKRKVCLKTLISLTELDMDSIQGILAWAKSQPEPDSN